MYFFPICVKIIKVFFNYIFKISIIINNIYILFLLGFLFFDFITSLIFLFIIVIDSVIFCCKVSL